MKTHSKVKTYFFIKQIPSLGRNYFSFFQSKLLVSVTKCFDEKHLVKIFGRCCNNFFSSTPTDQMFEFVSLLPSANLGCDGRGCLRGRCCSCRPWTQNSGYWRNTILLSAATIVKSSVRIFCLLVDFKQNPLLRSNHFWAGTRWNEGNFKHLLSSCTVANIHWWFNIFEHCFSNVQ